MNIDLKKINYRFLKKPLVIGGMAMQYYGLRKSGLDIDLVVTERDLANLVKKYPKSLKNLWGDLGVCVFEFEIWKTICYFPYDDLIENAVDKGEYLIISLEKLLLLKAIASKEKKYFDDMNLIIAKILRLQGGKYEKIKLNNKKLLQGINNIHYIQTKGPIH